MQTAEQNHQAAGIRRPGISSRNHAHSSGMRLFVWIWRYRSGPH